MAILTIIIKVAIIGFLLLECFSGLLSYKGFKNAKMYQGVVKNVIYKNITNNHSYKYIVSFFTPDGKEKEAVSVIHSRAYGHFLVGDTVSFLAYPTTPDSENSSYRCIVDDGFMNIIRESYMKI